MAGATWTAGASAQTVSTTQLVGNCVACHGMDGVSRGPVTPSIGGLSKPYFINAMLAFKYGKDSAKVEAAAKALKLSPDDIDGLPRLATVMDRLAKGYSDEDIGRMADYFAAKPFVAAKQKTDVVMAARGKQLHEDACEKCHENGGRKADEGGSDRQDGSGDEAGGGGGATRAHGDILTPWRTQERPPTVPRPGGVPYERNRAAVSP